MLGRTFVAITASLLAYLPAAADPAKMCGGKYADAAKFVDAAFIRYETLYSGGSHEHYRDSLLDTLNVYRLLKGYEPIAFKGDARGSFIFNRDDHSEQDRRDDERLHRPDESPEWLWNKIVWAVRPDAPGQRSESELFWAGFGWDIMTWGSRPADKVFAREPDADTPVSHVWMMRQMKTEPAYEWMQIVLAGSNTPWANNWVPVEINDPAILADHQALADRAIKHYENEQGVEWLAAAAVNTRDIRSMPALRGPLEKLAADVRACNATAAEYTALASSLLAVEHSMPDQANGEAWLEAAPSGVRAIARDFSARRALAQLATVRWIDRALVDRLISTDPQGLSQATGLLGLYAARNPAEIPLVSSIKTRRAYSVLSADTLAELGQRGKGDSVLVATAFARHVALGNTSKAAALIGALKKALPKDAKTINRIWSGRQPESVRVALIVLNVPSVSALVNFSDGLEYGDGDYGLMLNAEYYRGHRNLPSQYGKFDYLQRDFAAELHTDTSYYWGMRGSWLQWVDRLESRQLGGWAPPAAVSLEAEKNDLPFARLIAHDELKRLTGNQNLMVTVSNRIVSWAEQVKASGPDRELVADALAKMIRLCKYNTCGGTKARPAGKRAFQILKSRYRGTSGHRHTRWWYPTLPDYD